jgi:hypothetical protein
MGSMRKSRAVRAIGTVVVLWALLVAAGAPIYATG